MKNITFTVASGVTAAMLMVSPVLALNVGLGGAASGGVRIASTTLKVSAQAKLETRIATAKERANEEIDRRVAALSSLNTRVQAMVRLSAEQKSSIEKFIQDQETVMSSLKVKIAADTDIDTLKADIKSITQSYRIFILIMPQARITIASDKILTVADKLTAFEVKLAARIADNKARGQDVSAFEALDTDMKAKIADAKTQATVAVAGVVTLTPDNGDTSKAAANKQALQDSRSKIKAGLQALADARKDGGQIIAGLKGGASVAASTTVTQ